MNKDQLQSFEKIINYKFKQQDLLELALTHRSFKGSNNERLEFLGDSILNFIIADFLFKKFKNINEGDSSRLRSQLVKEQTLSDIAATINISDYLKLGEGELKSSGWRRPSIMADTVEAIIGALFLDGGIEASHQFISKFYEDKINIIDPKKIMKDPKSILQETLQARKIPLPLYEILSVDGVDHSQIFKISCLIPKLEIQSQGQGTSRKVAEQEAALSALKLIGSKSNDE